MATVHESLQLMSQMVKTVRRDTLVELIDKRGIERVSAALGVSEERVLRLIAQPRFLTDSRLSPAANTHFQQAIAASCEPGYSLVHTNRTEFRFTDLRATHRAAYEEARPR